MDEVFNAIHRMQDCLEEDYPVGGYSGEVLNFEGNNDF